MNDEEIKNNRYTDLTWFTDNGLATSTQEGEKQIYYRLRREYRLPNMEAEINSETLLGCWKR